MAERRLKLAFAGDRDVAVDVLDLLLELGDSPAALLLSDENRATHDTTLMTRCERAGITPFVIRGRDLNAPHAIELLRSLDLDYIICVHFPYVVRRPVLQASRGGVLNLHPAYLPYNRGWHTPSWAILDGTPAGATLHYMDESLDTGDVVCRRQIEIDPADTAHTLYLRLKALEVQVFAEGWQRIRSGRPAGVPQPAGEATAHRRHCLFEPAVQRIDLDAPIPARDLLRRLRALTTSRLDEAAYFVSGDRKYRVQVTITPESLSGPAGDGHTRLSSRTD